VAKRNLRLWLMFDGANYHGWQSQKNAVAIADVVTSALSRLTDEEIKLYGCSRTDAGVHAMNYCASFVTESSIPAQRFPYALNFLLPPDIRATRVEDVDEDFHAQYACIGKEYTYKLHYAQFDNPFFKDRVYHYRYGSVDAEKMDEAAKHFIGTHDFKSCMAQGSPVKSTVRTIKYFDVTSKGERVNFTVYADGFLYNMVRIMVGTLLEVGKGKLSPENIDDILLSKDRTMAGLTVPACGLYLTKVDYQK